MRCKIAFPGFARGEKALPSSPLSTLLPQPSPNNIEDHVSRYQTKYPDFLQENRYWYSFVFEY
jgi:hypothetical protein